MIHPFLQSSIAAYRAADARARASGLRSDILDALDLADRCVGLMEALEQGRAETERLLEEAMYATR
jgi:hypothetical protein